VKHRQIFLCSKVTWSKNMSKLAGKVAVITGGSNGIGFATAEQFVAEGAYVYITGRREKELDEAVTRIGRNVTGVQGDVSNLADLDRLYAQIAKEKGHIDILFANAGIAYHAPLDKITEEQFDLTFNINVRGLFFSVQKALPMMRNGGSIVLDGSATTAKALPNRVVYTATKAAIRSFASTMTLELRDRKIRVNAISPGFTETSIHQSKTYNLSPEQLEDLKSLAKAIVPLGRFARPEEIAKTVLFLASDDSSYITGVDLFVDGGTVQL
jgi:NAD(P)-dependent dehydrogenase (short-subunit alcohol dehydrogenase family)